MSTQLLSIGTFIEVGMWYVYANPSDRKHSNSDELVRFVDAMVEINLDAFNQRLHESERILKSNIYPYNIHFALTQYRRQVYNPVAILKLCDSIECNSSTGKGWTTRKHGKKAIDFIRGNAISALPTYDDCPWFLEDIETNELTKNAIKINMADNTEFWVRRPSSRRKNRTVKSRKLML